MNKSLSIQSSTGSYQVNFISNAFAQIKDKDAEKTQIIIDARVFALYAKDVQENLKKFPITQIEAIEPHKNVDQISDFVSLLMKNKVKIDHTLVAIGGGIIQDITCFIASTLFRGMKWEFIPTTLLAQADSCIGSKSSINVAEFKNLMGTFYPPQKILIDTSFLNTLSLAEIKSGIGEILKVHMIKGMNYFDEAASAYGEMLKSKEVLENFILRSLQYKKEKIELDEFDKGPRNVMNYGHSFGHAIEAATNFAIPHGIAVTIGMDMANFQSFKMGRIGEDQFLRWHKTLKGNYQEFSQIEIPMDLFISAIAKDKKNIGADLSLILVKNDADIEKVKVKNDLDFEKNCKEFLTNFLQ